GAAEQQQLLRQRGLARVGVRDDGEGTALLHLLRDTLRYGHLGRSPVEKGANYSGRDAARRALPRACGSSTVKRVLPPAAARGASPWAHVVNSPSRWRERPSPACWAPVPPP